MFVLIYDCQSWKELKRSRGGKRLKISLVYDIYIEEKKKDMASIFTPNAMGSHQSMAYKI